MLPDVYFSRGLCKALIPQVTKGKIMKILILIAVFTLMTSCASSPSNKEGRPFDANSAYCTQLRQKILNPYKDIFDEQRRHVENGNDDKGRLEGFDESITRSGGETEDVVFLHIKDCESQSAYNARIKERKFKYNKNYNRNKN